jgi:predicted RNA-binding protein YlqC (UPF0109 family)
VIESLVENKTDVVIERKEDELWVLLTLKVNKDDMWVIIWKNWNIVTSIRSLLRIVWNKIGKRVNLKILD